MSGKDEFGNSERGIRMVAIAARARGDFEAERIALDRLAVMESRRDMSKTVVYECDWCHEIVPKRAYSDDIDWGAHVTFTPSPGGLKRSYDICRGCAKVFTAVSEGKFKR